MAGRFPGAADVEQFWRNLRDGVERSAASATTSSRPPASPRDRATRSRLRHARGAVLDDADLFDAGFFGFIAARSARSSTRSTGCSSSAPGRRWSTPATTRRAAPGSVGVYAGASLNSYLLTQLLARPDAAPTRSAATS